ncbi:MAG: hypothetical protein HY329_27200 [Chloroflexi bacterium]|nr:hypothetical protein [Chloroflexota bacterium]
MRFDLVAATVGWELAEAGHRLRGVRLDSGDLTALSFEVQKILDAADLAAATIFASGNYDDDAIAAALERGALVDAFGVGSRPGVAVAAPYPTWLTSSSPTTGRPCSSSRPARRPGRHPSRCGDC